MRNLLAVISVDKWQMISSKIRWAATHLPGLRPFFLLSVLVYLRLYLHFDMGL